MPARGFQSSVDPRLHFGLAGNDNVDSILICWPGGGCTTLRNVMVNQILELSEDESEKARRGNSFTILPDPLFKKVTRDHGISYVHMESDFNDFERDAMLFQMMSNEGPAMAVADVNGDNMPDLALGRLPVRY